MKNNNIYNCLSIVNVKNKLGLQEIYSLGDIIYVRCPFCNSTDGAMKLNTLNNSYICKDCGESGYAIGLYAKNKYITNKEAYIRLIKDSCDVENNIRTSIVINNKKSNEELDDVYRIFLNLLTLNNIHKNKLLKLGFTLEDIKRIGFKSIPTNENTKIAICKKIIKNGYELCGVPGFFQDQRLRWNFVSHSGIFIPIIDNCKIVSLRIHLDKMYSTDTSDIWFSSNNKYNGTKASNNIMILYPEKEKIHLIKDNRNINNIIIVSEMLLAYKIHKQYGDKIVIRSTKCYF